MRSDTTECGRNYPDLDSHHLQLSIVRQNYENDTCQKLLMHDPTLTKQWIIVSCKCSTRLHKREVLQISASLLATSPVRHFTAQESSFSPLSCSLPCHWSHPGPALLSLPISARNLGPPEKCRFCSQRPQNLPGRKFFYINSEIRDTYPLGCTILRARLNG